MCERGGSDMRFDVTTLCTAYVLLVGDSRNKLGEAHVKQKET